MKYCVTGGLGFIGSKLIESFLENTHDTVYCVDSMIWGEQSIQALRYLNKLGKNKFKFVCADVRDINSYKKELGKCDFVYPLAALVGMPLCEKNVVKATQVNSDAIKLLVENLSSEQKIIFPNTNSGYGVGLNRPCTEEDKLTPISVYGKTKAEAESIILDNHPNSMVFRIATVFGVSPRMRFDLLVNQFTEEIYDNQHLQIFQPFAKRNYIAIDDVCEAFLHFTIFKDCTGIFNLGDSHLNCTKLEMAKKIFTALNTKESIYIKDDVVDMDKRDYIVSNAKLEASGFKCRADFNEVIDEISGLCFRYNHKDRLNWRNY